MKIICSIGPNVKKDTDIDEMIGHGMDMMRFNFSHINYEFTRELMEYSKEKYPKVPIIQDLQGNKLRISSLLRKETKVFPGDDIVFCSERVYYSELNDNTNKIVIPIKLEGEFSLLFEAQKFLMKDATMEFKIDSIIRERNIINTKVIRGGIIRGGKGINAPGINRSKMFLTKKDKNDVIFGLQNNVNIICLSYVSNSRDIEELKSFIKENVKKNPTFKMPKVWAKIESVEGVRNLNHILKVVDGIMLGRGDLSAEIDMVDLPKVQHEIINTMRKSDKEFVIGTYILESMKRSLIPLPSEVNDIYNFIRNKVDGVMLAGEVAIGRYPLETISFLKEIICTYK